MIFLNTGTQFPFERLVSAVDSWAGFHKEVEVFGQIGSSNYSPKNFDYIDFLAYQDYEHYFNKANLIISHAGMGNIIKSIECNKIIIMMPRKVEFNEHRNNHQVGTARRFKEKQNIYAVDTEKELHQILNQANELKKTAGDDKSSDRLEKAILNFLEEL